MSPDTRDRVEEQQAALLRSLTGHAGVPPGFESSDVEAATEALAGKRRRAVARSWPSLAKALGERFRERFEAFARATPLPSHGGPLADGRAFVRALARGEALPDAVYRQALAVDLRFRRQGDGLVPRRGFSVVCGKLPERRCLLLGLRWTGRGERWFHLG